MATLLFLAELIPAFSRLIILPALPEEVVVTRALERYLQFLLLYLAWLVMRRCALKLAIPHQKEDRRWRKNLILAAFVLAAVLEMVSLQSVRAWFVPAFFYLYLCAVSFDGLSIFLSRRNLHIGSSISKLLSLTMIGYLSFMSLDVLWEWRAAVFALSIASSVTAFRLAHELAARFPVLPSGTDGESKVPGISYLYFPLLFLGPIALACLSVAQELSKLYFCGLLALPLLGRFITRY